MSDEKVSQLSINIGKRVKYYVICYAGIILFLIWGEEIVDLVNKSLDPNPDTSEWAQKLISSLITVLGAVAFLLMNLGRDIDLHNVIDRWFFRVRAKTNKVIQSEMIKSAQKVGAVGWKNMERNEPEVTRLFYHFVNNQDTLRALAFTYWEQYFVNMYILFFGVLFFLISTVWSISRWIFDIAAFAPLVFVFIVTIVGVSTKYSLLPKIYALPVQQIGEICNSNTEQFKEQVKSRFGGVIVHQEGD